MREPPAPQHRVSVRNMARGEISSLGGRSVRDLWSISGGLRKPAAERLLQESIMIRFEVFKYHNGNIEDAVMGQAWRQEYDLQSYFISLD